MDLNDFALERFLARFEFTAPHMLSASDCEPMTVGELLALAGAGADALMTLGLGYTDPTGSPWLRARIAAFYPGLSDEDVLVTNAPEEAIFIAMSTLVAPGDRVIVLTPCYQALWEVARARGADVVAWPLVEREDGWRPDLERLASLLASAPTRLVVVNAPHNPTGWHPDRPTWDTIVALADRAGARLFADEMYRGLERDPADRLPPAASLHPAAVSLWGMSKSFGLGGLRIGWLATRDADARRRLLRMKDYTTICASALGELLAHLALGEHARIWAGHRATIDHNLDLARGFAARTGAIAWREPRAGSVALPRWRAGGVTALAERLATERGLVVVPSSTFDLGDDHIRLGLGRRTFGASLEILEASLAGSAARDAASLVDGVRPGAAPDRS
ncbi:MAG: pyridoxal phosphate-dependent aminotransferase [Deltaproteobacteria bacterium]|nr:pyridoxal phosphate-dependent aminotransferase [Deltaproteobacteria bacterium]